MIYEIDWFAKKNKKKKKNKKISNNLQSCG